MDVLSALALAGLAQQGLATRQTLTEHGVSGSALSRAVKAGTLVRLGRGLFAAAALPQLPSRLVEDGAVAPEFVLRVRAQLLELGAGAVAHGRTAAALYGWHLLVEPKAPEVAVAHGRSRAVLKGRRLAQRRDTAWLLLEAVPGQAGIAVTTAVQTVLDCCATLSLLQAVVVVDSALRSGHVGLDELHLAARTLRGRRRAAVVRRALSLADPESGSVLESVLRFRLVRAGVQGMLTQLVLRAGGRHLLRADFAFPLARLVVETDGRRWHSDARRDRKIDNALAVLGWRVLRYEWSEVVHDGDRVVAEIMAALAVDLGAVPAGAQLLTA